MATTYRMRSLPHPNPVGRRRRERALAVFGAVETRFKLPVKSVDALIQGGGEALPLNPSYRAFLKGQ